MAISVGRYQPAFSPLTNGGTLVSPLSAAGTYNSGDIFLGSLDELAFDISVTTLTGTSPTLTFSISRKGSDGVYYTIYTGTVISATGVQSAHLGKGLPTNVSLGPVLRVTCVAGGTVTSAVFTVSMLGK